MSSENVETIEHAEGFFGGTVEHQVVQPSAPLATEPRPHPSGSGDLLIVRDGYRVEHVRGRQQGKRGHVFHDLESLAAWLNRHASAEPTETEILMRSDGVVTAALQPSDPHGDVVIATLRPHPVYAAWAGVLGKALDQRAFQQHVRCYRDSLGEQAAALLSFLSQIDVTTGGNSTLKFGVMGDLQLTGVNRKAEMTVSLPSEITVRTPIFDGVRNGTGGIEPAAEVEYDLLLFLSVDLVGQEEKRPVFTLTCPTLELVRRQAVRDAASYLDLLLNDGFLVGLGEIMLSSVPKID